MSDVGNRLVRNRRFVRGCQASSLAFHHLVRRSVIHPVSEPAGGEAPQHRHSRQILEEATFPFASMSRSRVDAQSRIEIKEDGHKQDPSIWPHAHRDSARTHTREHWL